MTLEQIDKPEGYDGAYRFFRNTDTGRLWKVRLDLREARQPHVDSSSTLAPGNYSASISVSPAMGSGKAVREGGLPVVIDSHTHTFTHVEMADPEFDPEKRIMLIIEERVAAGEARMAAMSGIRDFAANWA